MEAKGRDFYTDFLLLGEFVTYGPSDLLDESDTNAEQNLSASVQDASGKVDVGKINVPTKRTCSGTHSGQWCGASPEVADQLKAHRGGTGWCGQGKRGRGARGKGHGCKT